MQETEEDNTVTSEDQEETDEESGAIINTSADIVGDTAKETVDIAEGTVQSIGNLLQNRDNMGDESLDQQQWNMNVFSMNPTPMPDSGYDSDLNSMQQQINKINKKINNEDMEAINNVKPAIESSADKEPVNFSKMNLGNLKNYIVQQGWVSDASKMKKSQILSLIEEHRE